MIPTISLCSFKGGAGRTTLTFNLGLSLSTKLKVLLVDVDPSCILTQLFLQNNEPKSSIFDSLSTVMTLSDEKLPPVDVEVYPNNSNLMLLPGSSSLIEYEGLSYFGISSEDPNYVDIVRGFYTVVQRTAEKCGADVVLLDLNSSIGFLNMLVVMFSTYFIVPVRDEYSLTLFDKHFENWEKKRNMVVKYLSGYQHISNNSIPLPTEIPKFIGLFCEQNFSKDKKCFSTIQLLSEELLSIVS